MGIDPFDPGQKHPRRISPPEGSGGDIEREGSCGGSECHRL